MKEFLGFKRVYEKVQGGQYSSHDTFRQEFIEALKNELSRMCPRILRLINPVLEYRMKKGRADLRIFNFVFEFDKPSRERSPILQEKKDQLLEYLNGIKDKLGLKSSTVKLYGVVTNGWFMEIHERGREPISGDFLNVSQILLNLICSHVKEGNKFPLIDPDDFISLFGVW